MSSLQSFFARASMKTVEQFEKLKQDAEKSFGIEVTVEDPILREVQNWMVEEEDVLEQIQKSASEFIDSVSGYQKRDIKDLVESMNTLVERRGTDEQKYRILGQLQEYKSISEEACSGEDSVANWLILELQANVLNPIEKQLLLNETLRSKFWKQKELKRHAGNLTKISNVDKKSKTELLMVQKDCADLEKDLMDRLFAKKTAGVAGIDTIWNEYCRIEAEYFTRMNDVYLEPSTPKPVTVQVSEAKQSAPRVEVAAPVIGGESEDDN